VLKKTFRESLYNSVHSKHAGGHQRKEYSLLSLRSRGYITPLLPFIPRPLLSHESDVSLEGGKAVRHKITLGNVPSIPKAV
jgi:hypothetical protein